MGAEVNPYEQQLLAVFNSCDEENRGSLDRPGLLLLCDQLQLEEQGTQLVERLLDGVTKRVTFIQFRDGLLALLDQGTNNEKDQDGNDKEELPLREVSPKFVFGKKKYGRRTRPKSTDLNSEQQDDSDSDGTTNSINISKSDQDLRSPHSDKATVPKKRKTSLKVSLNEEGIAALSGMEDMHDSVNCDDPAAKLFNPDGADCLRRACERLGVGSDGYIDRAELALVCDQIGMEKLAEDVVNQVFDSLDESGDNRISFEQFLLLFRDGGSVSNSDANSTPERENPRFERHLSASAERPTVSCTSENNFWLHDLSANGIVSSDLILEVWETAGVPDGASLLANLGFTEPRVKLSELIAILTNELHGLRADIADNVPITPTEMIYQATLALSQTEVRCFKSSFEQVCRERDKLRIDITEANERASLLAQEVDDHHSRLENSNKAQIKSLEHRYAESVKELTERLTTERDQFAHQYQTLEGRVWELEALDSQTRSELAAFKEEAHALSVENQNVLEQLSAVEVKYFAAQKELDAYENFRQGLSELEISTDNAKVKALLEKLEDVQGENTDLRDRNDELTMQVESLATKLAQAVITLQKPGLLSDASQDARQVDKGCGDQSCGMADDLVIQGSAIKRRGDPPDSFLTLEESSEDESPRLEKVRRCCSTPEQVDMPVMQVRTLTPSGKVIDLIYSEDFLLNDSSSNDNTLDSMNASKSSSSNLEDSERCQGDTFNQQLEMLTEKLSVREEEFNENREHEKVMYRNELAAIENQKPEEYNRNAKETTEGEQENTKEQLEQHCRDLKSQLDQVKIEIVKILSERNASSKENCALKDHIFDLETSLVNSLPVEENSLEPRNANVSAVEWKPDSQEARTAICKMYERALEGIFSMKRTFADKLSIQEAIHTQEKIDLLERCTNLESSIEMLREEYEQCEDYWSTKLDEERVYFDKENGILGNKYQTLLTKLGNCDDISDDRRDCITSNGRGMSTIDEYAMLESQVIAVEIECDDLKNQLELERGEREAKIQELTELLEEHQSKCTALHGEQVMSMLTKEAMAMNWESSDNEQEDLSTSEACAILTPPTLVSEDHENAFLPQNFTNIGTQVPEGTANEVVRNSDVDNICNKSKNLKEELLADVKLLEEKRASLQQAMLEAKESGGAKKTCQIDMNFLQTMNARWQQQEQRCGELQAAMKQRQIHTETVLGKNWASYRAEVEEMENVLTQTQEHLHQQSLANSQLMDRLARNDLLVRDLYVENAYLVATVQRLEQRCQALVQMTTDSLSV